MFLTQGIFRYETLLKSGKKLNAIFAFWLISCVSDIESILIK